MRIFALSDIHVDYEANARWVGEISSADHQNDMLILAGDVSDDIGRFEWCLTTFARRFRTVLFVPGNHDLWVSRDGRFKTSFEKFAEVERVVERSGGSMRASHADGVSIIPLFGWYDYSFGEPGDELKRIWMDYRACRWPDGFAEQEIAEHFDALNGDALRPAAKCVISFSHFMPRIDLMPAAVPPSVKALYPILGTTKLERRIRLLAPDIHVYGHSHLNRRVQVDNITYINNAFGYPSETRIAGKRLLCIHDS